MEISSPKTFLSASLISPEMLGSSLLLKWPISEAHRYVNIMIEKFPRKPTLPLPSFLISQQWILFSIMLLLKLEKIENVGQCFDSAYLENDICT